MQEFITILKPFTREIEIELFEKARKIDRINAFLDRDTKIENPYREQLIHQVIPLAEHILKVRRDKPPGGAGDDWHSEALMAIVIAYDKYDHLKGFRWTTYSADVVWKRLILWQRKDKLSKRMSWLEKYELADVISRAERDTHSAISEKEMREVIDSALDGRQKEIMILRLRGLTLKEVGEYFNVTRERIRQIELKAKEALKDELCKRGFGNEFNQPCSCGPIGVCSDLAAR